MATDSGLQKSSPWSPFLVGVSLLLVGGIGAAVGIWFLWDAINTAFGEPTVSAYESEHVTYLGTHDYELLQLVRVLYSERSGESVSPRVKKILELQSEAWRRGDQFALNLEHWALELRKLQAAEARELRAKQVKESCLVGFPLLVVGVVVGWLGLRGARANAAQVRAELGRRFPATVFDQETDPVKKASGSERTQTPRVPSETEKPINCLQCGKRMPVAAPKCPACGWSYGEAQQGGCAEP
jgi:hypothetical protein